MQNKKVAKGRRGGSVVSKETYYTLLKKGYKGGRKKRDYDTVYERPSLRFILTRPPCSISTFILCSFS